MLDQEEISPFKDTLILYTLTGALALLGVSWIVLGWKALKNQKS